MEAIVEEEGVATEVEALNIKREEAVSSNNSNNNRRISQATREMHQEPTSM
jgi:hypothetical protein